MSGSVDGGEPLQAFLDCAVHEAVAALYRCVREAAAARGSRLPIPFFSPVLPAFLCPADWTFAHWEKCWPTKWPEGQEEGPPSWVFREAQRVALRYATNRVTWHAVVQFLDGWSDGRILLRGRRADGALAQVPRNLRCSRFMALHTRNGLLVPAHWQGQAPAADLPLYSDITVWPVERAVSAGPGGSVAPEAEPEASADLPDPAIPGGVFEIAGSPNTVAAPPRAASNEDLDNCIKASAAGSKDGKTSGRQLRHDAPTWFAAHEIRPVTQADMERRLNENNAALRRGIGKRRN